jgi:hypothetical protein
MAGRQNVGLIVDALNVLAERRFGQSRPCSTIYASIPCADHMDQSILCTIQHLTDTGHDTRHLGTLLRKLPYHFYRV